MRLILLFLSIGFIACQAIADTGVQVNVQLSPAGSFVAKTEKVEGAAFKTGDGVMAENVQVDLGSLQTGIGLRDKHMKERLMLDKYPKAILVKAVGKDGKGKGVLQIKGKQQEVQGTYKVENGTLKAEFSVNLPALDIKDVKYMGVGVKDNVTISIALPLQDGAPRAAASQPKKK